MSKFIDEINKIIIEKGSKRRSEIKKRFDDIEIECQSGHIFQISPKLIKDGKWCPACNENFSENIKKILDTIPNGTKLSSLQIHDIQCHIADAVLSGGIRRAAMISLFDIDDEDMLKCKHGEW